MLGDEFVDTSEMHSKIERFETEYWKRMAEAKIELFNLQLEIYKAQIELYAATIPEQETPCEHL